MTDFERVVTLSPAFDRRSDNPRKNYGIHGVELRMILKGPLGATQFLLFTNWQLPHVTKEHDHDLKHILCRPMPADLGYHSPKPQYDGQTSLPCDLLPGGRCYYDGSGLNAEDVYTTLLTEGSDGVWKRLEEYYREMFETESEPEAVAT